MQQFTVPQFIDVEDKIIGSLTVRQFLITLGALAVIGVAYKIFDFSLFLLIGILTLVIAGIFAFVKIGGAPFHYFVLNLLKTLTKPRLRVWNKLYSVNLYVAEQVKVYKEDLKVYNDSNKDEKRLNTSRLSQLALIVDTKGYYKGEFNQEGLDDTLEVSDMKIE